MRNSNMNITKDRVKQIIKEELKKAVGELLFEEEKEEPPEILRYIRDNLDKGAEGWFMKGAVWEPQYVKDSDEDVIEKVGKRFLGMSTNWLVKKRGYVWNEKDGDEADLLKIRDKRRCLAVKFYTGKDGEREGSGWEFPKKWTTKQKLRYAKRAKRWCTVVNPSLKASYPKYKKWKCKKDGGTWKRGKCIKAVSDSAAVAKQLGSTERTAQKDYALTGVASNPQTVEYIKNVPEQMNRFVQLVNTGKLKLGSKWTPADVNKVKGLKPLVMPKENPQETDAKRHGREAKRVAQEKAKLEAERAKWK